MRSDSLVVLVAIAFVGCSNPAPTTPAPGPVDAIDSLVAAERAFAADATERDIPSAFLAVLAYDGVVFSPGPTRGRDRFERIAPSDARLEWAPVVAEVSAAGDVGMTTGPYTLRPDGSPDAPVAHGHFLSVWTRTQGGPWRLAADHGIAYDAAPAEPEDFRSSRGVASADHALDTLHEADRASADSPCIDTADADLRVHRNGEPPALGAAAACDLEKRTTAGTTVDPMGGGVSESGDLGYTWGRLDVPGEAGRGFAYLRVWRRHADGWKRIADVATDWPRPPDPGPA